MTLSGGGEGGMNESHYLLFFPFLPSFLLLLLAWPFSFHVFVRMDLTYVVQGDPIKTDNYLHYYHLNLPCTCRILY